MRGIDCASYQAGIDPHVVPCDFVIVKSTQGTGYVNPDFRRLADATLDAGKALGIYHYGAGNDATAEAEHMLDVAGDYIGRAVFFLDWEGVQNPAFESGNDRAWIDEFCSAIEARIGSQCPVYLSQAVMWMAEGHPLWVAQYANMRSTGYQDSPWNEGAYSCMIRQYTSMGRLDGWGGDLDLDKSYISRDEWDAWASGNGSVTPHEPSGDEPTIEDVQEWVGAVVDGVAGDNTHEFMVRKLQSELNAQFDAGVDVDGVFGPITKAACVTVRRGARGNLTKLIQGVLIVNGLTKGGFDGIFGDGTADDVGTFQRRHGIADDEVVGKVTWEVMLG
jgi:GH25 family lysozyme M1 (1,4-beta-N-acetylmuramidase)